MNHYAFIRKSNKRTGWCIILWKDKVKVAAIRTTNRSPIAAGKVVMWWCVDGVIPIVDKYRGIEEVINYEQPRV